MRSQIDRVKIVIRTLERTAACVDFFFSWSDLSAFKGLEKTRNIPPSNSLLSEHHHSKIDLLE